MRLEGSKMGDYIVIIGEGKLKRHQINGSLHLGNIIVHLPLPQLIPIVVRGFGHSSRREEHAQPSENEHMIWTNASVSLYSSDNGLFIQ